MQDMKKARKRIQAKSRLKREKFKRIVAQLFKKT